MGMRVPVAIQLATSASFLHWDCMESIIYASSVVNAADQSSDQLNHDFVK